MGAFLTERTATVWRQEGAEWIQGTEGEAGATEDTKQGSVGKMG